MMTRRRYFNDGGMSDMDTSKTHPNIDGDQLHDFVGGAIHVVAMMAYGCGWR
jgi:hypothetical protein|eukprot:COSAG01_NODE_7041_length_3380_cov_6.993600_3_plen_52_part_00